MASFHATLVVGSAGQSGSSLPAGYPIDICTQHMQQNVDHMGRPTSRTYAGELHITMPPPEDTQLMAWAKDPKKALSCSVIFRDLDGASPSLVLELERAFCVSYVEHFQPDLNGNVAYFCQLSITAERFTKQGTDFPNHWQG